MITLFLLSCVYTYPNLRIAPQNTPLDYAPLYKRNTAPPPEKFEAPSVEGIFEFKLPEPAQLPQAMELWATYYFTPIYPYSKTEKHRILNLKGKAFASTSHEHGSVISVEDERVVAGRGSENHVIFWN